MRYFCFVVCLFIPFICSNAQTKGSPLAFDAYQWDFGKVNEDDGTLFCIFRLANTADAPVRISRVVPSCNCVSVSFPQEYLSPGEYAQMNVSVNTAGMAGPVERSFDVICSDKSTPVTIRLKADVNPSPRPLEDVYKVSMPQGLRLSTANVRFGYVARGANAAMYLDMANTSDRELSLACRHLPSGSPLKIDCPTSVAPGQQASIRLSYDRPSRYGLYADTLQLVINGAVCSKLVTVSAICVDNFDDNPLSVPFLQASPSLLKLERGFLSRFYSASLTVANIGEAVLVLHSLDLPKGMSSDFVPQTRLAHGESVRITVRTSQSGSFRIGLVSNDPDRPYKEILVQ